MSNFFGRLALFCITVTAAMVGTATLQRATSAQAAADACTVLSVDEVARIVGRQARAPRRGTAEVGTSCRFPTATESVTVALWPTDANDFVKSRDFLIETGEKLEPIPELGDAAYFWGDRVYVRKGVQGLTIYIGGAGDGSDVELREIVVALAKAALAKL